VRLVANRPPQQIVDELVLQLVLVRQAVDHRGLVDDQSDELLGHPRRDRLAVGRLGDDHLAGLAVQAKRDAQVVGSSVGWLEKQPDGTAVAAGDEDAAIVDRGNPGTQERSGPPGNRFGYLLELPGYHRQRTAFRSLAASGSLGADRPSQRDSQDVASPRERPERGRALSMYSLPR